MDSDREQRILEGAALWASYFRANPHRFAEEYLHVQLRLFQKILLVMMNHNYCNNFVFVACRGIGKTFLSSLFCVIRCILWPGTQVVVVSNKRGQAINVLEKIQNELIPNSPELAAEIKAIKIGTTDAVINFHNSSFIKVVTASDNARGNRATLLLIDEFRMVSKDIIDTVLKKFLTKRRMPPLRSLSDKERKAEWDKEKSAQFYLSSAYFVDHWSYDKCRDTCRAMLDDTKRQFICGLPYQLSIKEGLLDRELLEDEMMESDYNEVKFRMEYEALWYGVNDGAFFDYSSVSKNRKIKHPMLPGKLADKLGNAPAIRIPTKAHGEVRILSADIALMSSAKNDNDATAIFVNQMLPTKTGRFTSNIVYTESAEGLRTDEQALMIRRLFEEYDCDHLALDCNGIGLGVYDLLASDLTDPDSGEIYPALSCCNDQTMASRCTVPNAEKAIWSIKASAQMNSDIAYLLREGFKSGRIRILESEYDADENLSSLKGYSSLSPSEKMKLQMPYIQTTLLIDELTKLRHDETNGRVKLIERSGMRKDRYSSLAYNYYVAVQVENKIRKRRGAEFRADKAFIIKPPKSPMKGGMHTRHGNERKDSWNN